MWLSDDCADKHLGHLICRVSEMTSPLLSSGIYFKLMWPEHRQYRQKKNYLELPLRISIVSQWHSHKQPVCVCSALCWVSREVSKEREDFFLGKLRHDSGIQIKAN